MADPEARSDTGALHALPRPGELIADKYRVEEVVGSGGMGVVVSARHERLGQAVAVKLLGPDASRRPEAARRFLREAQAAAGLQSDHVVKIHDVGTTEQGAPFIVMELLRGSDLKAVLDERGALPVQQAVEYVLQASDAIGEAHGRGIVHRDLKPANLFVCQRSDGSPLIKVLDFGISKSLQSDESVDGALTSTRSVLGSPYYMSPEQVRDSKKIDHRADIWALGVILQELLTAEPAFVGDTLPAVCAAIVADPPAPLHERRPDVPQPLADIVLRCLEKDPSRRFQTVGELVEALLPFAERRSVSPSARASSRALSDATLRSSEGFGDARTLSTEELQAQRSPLSAATRVSVGAPPPPDAAEAALARTRSSLTGSQQVRRKRPWILGAAALALAVAGSIQLVRSPASMDAVVSSAPPPAEGAEATSFELRLDSTPTGAEVLEDGRRLGTTPLVIRIDDPSLARRPRTFALRSAGYQDYVIEQGPSTDNVRVHAALAVARPPAPSPPVQVDAGGPSVAPKGSEPDPKAAPRPRVPSPAPEPVPSSQPAEPDIRLQR